MHALKPSMFAAQVAGLPLSVAFADAEELASLREALEGGEELVEVLVNPPFHVSTDDAYLVLPEDIALDLREMFQDGDCDLLGDAMKEGLVVIGTLEKAGRGTLSAGFPPGTRSAGFPPGTRSAGFPTGKWKLVIDKAAIPAVLMRTMPYADSIEVGRGQDPIETLNALPQAKVTLQSELMDHSGLQRLVTGLLVKPDATEHAGISWKAPRDRKDLTGVDPTFAWSKKHSDGKVGIEAALFCEYEELVVVLRPALLHVRLSKPTLSLAL